MAATPKKLTDKEAKAILKGWPKHSGDVVSSSVWPTPTGTGCWLQAQPPESSSRSGPRLRRPGAASFSTQPDGMWTWLAPEAAFVDVLVIEVCGTVQNLNDKRSRYAPATGSLLLAVPEKWILRKVSTRGGSKKRRRELAGLDATSISGDLMVPVRWCQVLYSLPNDVYKQWTAHQTPAPHEYLCRHSSLGSYSSQPMQDLLTRMTLRSHYLTEPGK